MARRSDSSLASLLLSQRLVDVDASPLGAGDYWGVLAQVGDPACLLGKSETDLCELLDDSEMATRVATRMDAAIAFAFEFERLEQLGIQMIASVDDAYPSRLRDRPITKPRPCS